MEERDAYRLNTLLAVLLIIAAATVATMFAYFQTTVKSNYNCRADYLDKYNEALIARTDSVEKTLETQTKLIDGVGDMIISPDPKLSEKEQAARFAQLFIIRKETSDELKAERANIVVPPKPNCAR